MESKRHGIVSNLIYVFKPAVKARPVLLLNLVAEALLFALLPLAASATTSMVVGMLDGQVRPAAMIGMILAVFAIYGGLQWFYTYRRQSDDTAYACMRLDHHYIPNCCKGTEISLEQFENNEIRQLKERALLATGNGVDGVEGIIRYSYDIVSCGLGLLVYMITVGLLDIKVMLLLVALSAACGMVSHLCARKFERIRPQIAERKRVLYYLNRVVDDRSGGKDIRVFRLAPWLLEKYDQAIKAYQKLRTPYRFFFFADAASGNVADAVRTLVCYLYLIAQLRQGMPITEFVFFLGVTGGISSWFTKLVHSIVFLYNDNRMVDDYRSWMELENGVKDEGKLPPQGFDKMEIVFDKVTYRYPGAKNDVLHNLSFTMKPGEHIALVGLNGAGKSTLVKLMSGLYLPTEGHIYINGVDTRELNRVALMRHTAAIFQTVFTTSYSIGENITFAEQFEEKPVWDALETAGLAEKVRAMPKGLKTCLGKDVEDDGVQLSGGETQRLLLARAIYRNPALLLLDEPTAALDAIAENEIYELYSNTLQGRNALFISHRLASTRFCDRILLLEDGVILEQGSHEALLRQKGRYAQLFELQSKYYREDA